MRCLTFIFAIFLLTASCQDDGFSFTAGNENSLNAGSSLETGREIGLQSFEATFYWNQWPLDENKNFDRSRLTSGDTLQFKAPLWTQLGYPAKGYGTYALTLKDVAPKTVMVFDRSLGACEIWLNGELLNAYGEISKTPDTEKLNGKRIIVPLPAVQQVDIHLAMSNHGHRLGGGFPLNNYIIQKDAYEQQSKSNLILESIALGLIFFFGIFQIINHFTFPTYKQSLYLGLLFIVGGSRQLFVGEGLVFYFFEDIPFAIIQKMRYLCYYGGLMCIGLYHYYLFPRLWLKNILTFVIISCLTGILFVLITPVYLGTWSAPFFQFLGLVLIIVGLFQMIQASIKKQPFAIYILISLLVMSVLLINDLLNAMLLIQTTYLVNYGFIFYVISQVLINRKIQLNSDKELKRLVTDFSEMQDHITQKNNEITDLLSDSYKHLKTKENLITNLKELKQSQSPQNIQSIILDVQADLDSDEKSALILESVDKSYYDLILVLKNEYPNLTKTDLQICTYIVMGLDRNDIARLRNVSIHAVKKSTYRIRKKLEISPEIQLKDFLSNLSKD